jgi:branched-chain amino acid transport system ATP-binding protein
VTGAPPYALAELGLKRAFQQNAFFAEMPVLDNMAAVLQPARGTGLLASVFAPWREAARRRALEAEAAALLRRFGVPEAMHGSRPGALPYGTQRMLSIALAWGTGAKVLMLDEPAAGLGGEDMLRLRDLLGALRAEGAALVVIEHHMDLIMSVADRIVVLDGGRRLATGTPREVQADARVLEAYLGRAA